MKISREDIREFIKESYNEYDSFPEEKAIKIIEKMMVNLENKFYGKYSDEEVDNFAVESMAILGQLEPLLVKLMSGGYNENF